ncbi:MAG: hypothetical protein Q8R92_00440 [Deltaproteobacteria bacterium]|nr:hypothetical protein [Deltaproteobacteria bacterium]
MSGKVSKFLFAFLVAGLVLVPVARNFAQDMPEESAVDPTVEAPTQIDSETTAAEVEEVQQIEAESVVKAKGGIGPESGLGVFSRHADPVVLKGEQIPKFAGATEDTIRVFANKDGSGLKPIPYQMDERNQWGEFVVIKGKRVVADEDEGAFDENDEVVFLTRDLGSKAAKDSWPSGFKEAYEVEVTDPLTSVKGYAYVLSYASASAAPAPSTDDYISYEEKGQGVTHAMSYELGFVKPASGLDYDLLTVMPAAGGSGKDWFDRLKVRVLQNLKRFMTLGIPTRLDRTEKNFLVKVYGYKDGPVRVLRVMKVNLQLIWKLPAPGATVNSVFYPEWIEWPVPVNLPFKPSWAFYNVELDVSHDYDFGVNDGVKVYNSKDQRWDVVDGKMTPEETAVNKADVRGSYYGFDATAAGHGAGFYTVRPPKSFSASLIGLYNDSTEVGVEPEYYEGDGNKKDREENIAGALPLAGGRFVNWDDVGKGIHTIFWYHFYPPFYTLGKEKAFLDIIDHPISVTVN